MAKREPRCGPSRPIFSGIGPVFHPCPVSRPLPVFQSQRSSRTLSVSRHPLRHPLRHLLRHLLRRPSCRLSRRSFRRSFCARLGCFFASVNSSAACPAPPRPLRPALLSHQLFRGLLPRTFRALPNLLCPHLLRRPSSLPSSLRPVPFPLPPPLRPPPSLCLSSLPPVARPARLFPAPDDVPPVLLRKPLRTPRCPPFTRSGTPSPPRCARSVRPRRPVTSFRPKNCPIVREKMQKITLPALSRFLIVIFFTFLKVFIPLCRRTPCCGPLPAGARGDDRARRRNALTTTGQRI